jgi:hypothetical protein
MTEAPARAHHDIGGVERFQCAPIDTTPHALSDFDREVDALRQILAARGLMSVDQLRRCIEAIPEAEYHCLGYYQRWMRAMTDYLLDAGVLGEAELRAALAAA